MGGRVGGWKVNCSSDWKPKLKHEESQPLHCFQSESIQAAPSAKTSLEIVPSAVEPANFTTTEVLTPYRYGVSLPAGEAVPQGPQEEQDGVKSRFKWKNPDDSEQTVWGRSLW